MIINEGKPEGGELITEQVMQEHKTKLLTHYKEKNVDGIIEVLLSLRVNALQIAPELRKNLVYELVRNDIFLITENDSFEFPMGILEINNSSLKHAITSLISVIASTLKGVEYLSHKNKMQIVEKIIKVILLIRKNYLKFLRKDLERTRKWKCYTKILYCHFTKMQY